MRWGGSWEGVQEGGNIYIPVIHFDVWQKPTQYCKAVTLQVKINKLIIKNNVVIVSGTQPYIYMYPFSPYSPCIEHNF